MNLNAYTARAAMGLRSCVIRAVLLLACVLGAGLAGAAVPAGAKVIHAYEGSFTGSETPVEAFGVPLAVAVDNSAGPNAGDVYVGGETSFGATTYVYKFSKDGKYTGVEFKGSETAQGSFTLLDTSNFEASRGLAVDESTGANRSDVYLADAEHDVIDRFSEDGKFLCEITGREYSTTSTVEREHECAGAAGSKTPQDGFHVAEGSLDALGVAVDPQNGDVYVSSPADKTIDKFNEAGEYIGQIEGSHLTAPGSLAFNAEGELYVANGGVSGGENVIKLDATGAYVSTLDENAPRSVAVDLADGRVYVAEGSSEAGGSGEEETVEYDATGKLLGAFGKEQSGAVAVSDATGRIYVTPLFSSFVYMYGKAVVVPNVTTGAASEVKEQSATLHGEADPDPNGGNIASCQFEYASESTLHHVQKVGVHTINAGALGRFKLMFDGQSTGWSGEGKLAPESKTVAEVGQAEGLKGFPIVGEEIYGAGIRSGTTILSYSPATHEITLSQDTEKTVSAAITGLNAELTAYAQTETVKDALEALGPPRSGVIPTQRIGSGDVAVSGPAGGPWTVEFTGSLQSALVPLLEFETSEDTVEVDGDWAAASRTACEPVPPYSAAEAVSAQTSGLTASAGYEYRLTATDSEGPATGEVKSFDTYGPPTVDRESAEALQTAAELKAHIDPHGYDTTCQMQYVSDAEFQQSQWASATTLPCQPEDLGSRFEDLTVAVKVHGLARATIYHYRFLASNQSGASTAAGGAFETYGIRHVSMEFLKNATFNGENKLWQAGEPETLQAGAHPYELATTVTFSHTTEFSECAEVFNAFPLLGCPGEIEVVNSTAVNTKDIKVELPPGVVGNPTSLPKCNRYLVQLSECPPDTQVGIIEVWVDYPLGRGNQVWPLPEDYQTEEQNGRRYLTGIYNVEPAGPHPAEFAAFIEGQAPAWIPFEVRTGSDYGITANSIELTDVGGGISQVRTRIWGDPADPRHEAERHCPENYNGQCADTEAEVPLLTDPTSCAGPLTVTTSADSWQEPGQDASKTIEVPGFTGCDKLRFEPSIEAQPTTNVADSPSGLQFDLHVPQDVDKEGHEEPNGLATADVRNTKVVLPAGMVVDPSSADGLATCSEEQVGYLPAKSAEVGRPQFTPDPAECPDAAKIGSVEVDSSLVDHPLFGAVYVATQDANPFKSLLALYVTVYDAQTGVVIKLPAKVTLDANTGQLTTTVDEDPQLPFNDFKLNFFPGPRAALTTPLMCGSYAISSDLTPWSSPEGADATPSSLPFSVANAPGGAACASSEAQAPNAPGFAAGTASPIAGAYSPFVLKLEREDGSQHFNALNVTMPPGLTGKIAGIEQCPQTAIDAAQARSHEGEGGSELAHPACPVGSEVGLVHVGVGSGAPYYQTGRAYFAGPYKGAPFSLVVITPAVAGPFDLGVVVVRAALYIDPYTTQVTVKSDPFPTILDGIPLDIRSVSVDVNRKEFTLNPTSCSAMSVNGLELSTAGPIAALSDPFQASGCTTLPFQPSFSASASGITSRKAGASLVVNVASNAGQANLAKVKVTLPKQLPSRLSTLQLACQESVFAANPASCPQGSVVGMAVAHTPLLSSSLTGPVYIVSHGGAAFPDVEVVLQAEGVMIVLDGKTDIQNGITTSTFETIPDAPISSFEMRLPEGPHSILGAPGGLCSLTRTVLVKKQVTVTVRRHGRLRKRRVTRVISTQVGLGLVMPTLIQGQNGAVINQQTPIDVTGCKTSIRVLRHNVHADKVTIVTSVPSAGKLTISGAGLSRGVSRSGAAATVTSTLTVSKSTRALLRRHQGRKLKVTLKLVFTPVHGPTLTGVATVLIG